MWLIVYFKKETHGELGGSWHKLYSMHLPVKRTWFFCLSQKWEKMIHTLYMLSGCFIKHAHWNNRCDIVNIYYRWFVHFLYFHTIISVCYQATSVIHSYFWFLCVTMGHYVRHNFFRLKFYPVERILCYGKYFIIKYFPLL